MPIIKSAKKRVKQTEVRKARNYKTRVAVKKAIRAVTEAVKAGNKAEAEKLLAPAYKIIDTAAKKNVLNSKTAARRKSSLANMIAKGEVKAKAEEKAKAEPKKKKEDAPKKSEKAEATEEASE